MELYIFDRLLNFKGIVDNFISLRWVRRYFKCGEFELQCVLTPEILILLQEECIIYKKDDTEVGVIGYVNYKLDSESKEIIVIKGRFATGYLTRRIALGATVINNTAENAIRGLVTDNAVSPTNTNRVIPNLLLGVSNGYTGTISYTLDNKELLEDITNIATLGALGFRTEFNTSTKKLTFNIYKGLDRSVNQSANSRAIFSKEFENILEQEYTNSLDNYKNVAYDLTTSLGNSTGLDRFELFVDKDLAAELSKRLKLKTFDSKINLNSNLKYKFNFDLGDIITIVSKKWGITLDSRITEIEEIYEENRLSINAVFGNSIPTLIDKIKQIIK
ncbi:MAG: siphovirus ReqiPepy6 Gp37-like family protein [Clostridium sp.]|uniref:siphovirus ReqiPepy6 Gp37-like family protein n=1 Tax=Clostridium sp. TaxID=1506 RepID=UPI003D6CE06D